MNVLSLLVATENKNICKFIQSRVRFYGSVFAVSVGLR
jgi:hypothetical protein